MTPPLPHNIRHLRILPTSSHPRALNISPHTPFNSAYYAPITQFMEEDSLSHGADPPDFLRHPTVPPINAITIHNEHLPSPPTYPQLAQITDRLRESYIKRKLTERLLAFQEEEEVLVRRGQGREALFKRRSSDELFRDAYGSPGGFGQENSSHASSTVSPPSITRDELLLAVKAEKEMRRKRRSAEPQLSQDSQTSSEGVSRKSTFSDISNGGMTESKSTTSTPSTSYCATPIDSTSSDQSITIQALNPKKRPLEDAEDELPAKRRRIDDIASISYITKLLPLPTKESNTPSTIRRSHLPTPSTSDDEICRTMKNFKRRVFQRNHQNPRITQLISPTPLRRSPRLRRAAPEFGGLGYG